MMWEPIICTAIVCLTAVIISEKAWMELFQLRVWVNSWLQEFQRENKKGEHE